MDQKHVGRTGGASREAYYQGLFLEQESSGQSLRAFARERGLSPWTLYGWRGKLGRSRRRRRSEESGSNPSGLVAVDVVGRSGLIAEEASDFEVVLGDGLRVRVPRDTAIVRLAELVRALRSC